MPKPVGTTKAPPASIVLLSDGQSNTGPDPIKNRRRGGRAGIKVYTIGIGTPEGTILQIQGRNVFTRLDEDTLKVVAQKTEAQYFRATDEASLTKIYDDLTRERRFEDEETEITFAFRQSRGAVPGRGRARDAVVQPAAIEGCLGSQQRPVLDGPFSTLSQPSP